MTRKLPRLCKTWHLGQTKEDNRSLPASHFHPQVSLLLGGYRCLARRRVATSASLCNSSFGSRGAARRWDSGFVDPRTKGPRLKQPLPAAPSARLGTARLGSARLGQPPVPLVPPVPAVPPLRPCHPRHRGAEERVNSSGSTQTLRRGISCFSTKPCRLKHALKGFCFHVNLREEQQ